MDHSESTMYQKKMDSRLKEGVVKSRTVWNMIVSSRISFNDRVDEGKLSYSTGPNGV